VITDEQRAKLTPEQLVVAEKWEAETEARDRLIKQLDAATDDKMANDLIEQICALSSDMCEHGRSIWGSCSKCNAIEMILRPELFDEEGNLIDTD
jgi:predicted  nucleic acid-binding Zn ribbon protein